MSGEPTDPPTGRGRAGGVASWARERSERARSAADDARAWAERERGVSPGVTLAFDLYERDRARLGGLLAGALAYRLFLWLLPLMLLSVGVLGAVTSLDDGVPNDVSSGAGLGRYISGIVSDGAHQSGWWIAIPVGLFGALWAGMGVVRALRVSHAAAWGLRPDRASGALKGSCVLAAVVIALAAIAGVIGALRQSSALGGLLALLLMTAIYALGWTGISWRLPHRAQTARDLLPGGLVVAIGIEALHLFTVYYLAGRAERAASLYGTIGAALTLLLWLFLVARLMVGGAILNAELAARRSGDRESLS